MIRKANEQDIPRLLHLLRQVLQIHHVGRPDLFLDATAKYDADELRGILKSSQSPVFVCVDEADQVLGYAFCQFPRLENDSIRTDVKTLYIDDICVDEAARGRGVGRQLYEYVCSFARESECYNITLNVWSCNPAAMRFYESCGLKPQKVGMEYIL